MKLSELYQSAPGEGGLADLLGADEVFEEAGAVCVTLKLHEGLLNHAKRAHGGTISALVDVAVGAYHKWHGETAVALSSSLSYLRPAECGACLTARVSEIKQGRTVSVYQVCVSDERARLIAQATVSTFCTEKSER